MVIIYNKYINTNELNQFIILELGSLFFVGAFGLFIELVDVVGEVILVIDGGFETFVD
jgi:hypothetical protein